MLSKLQFFEPGGSTHEPPPDRDVQQAIERHFHSIGHPVRITPAKGGTLGLCFHLERGGARLFLKTHLPGERPRANLAKEADILVRLYGETVVLDRIEVRPQECATRLCVLMAELSPLSAPLSAEGAAETVRGLTNRIGEYRPAAMPAEWDFEHYLAVGLAAIPALEERGLIAQQTATRLGGALELLEGELGTLPRSLCHGDFGPKNTMAAGSQIVAIDWEDAFWGVSGYDYLYWLTFVDNRPFLHSAAFGRTGLEPAVERAILALVVLLKSYLSVRAGTYLRNAIPIETRIAEVFAIPGLGS